MARFVLNPVGVKALARDAGVRLALHTIAESIAQEVRDIGPKDDDADPHYVEAITVDSGVDKGMATARVNANKFTSNWIEFGTGAPGPTPAFAPMRRAVENLGFHTVGGKRR